VPAIFLDFNYYEGAGVFWILITEK